MDASNEGLFKRFIIDDWSDQQSKNSSHPLQFEVAYTNWKDKDSLPELVDDEDCDCACMVKYGKQRYEEGLNEYVYQLKGLFTYNQSYKLDAFNKEFDKGMGTTYISAYFIKAELKVPSGFKYTFI